MRGKILTNERHPLQQAIAQLRESSEEVRELGSALLQLYVSGGGVRVDYGLDPIHRLTEPGAEFDEGVECVLLGYDGGEARD